MEMKKMEIGPRGAAKCALDIGDGSERGEYVNQDYILQTLGRPHRNVSLMYTYYPYDKEWPERISVACKDMEIHFQWDYPYDDYFPYGGGLNGNTEGEPFTYMRDIRRHGQDVSLTLTIDCSVKEEDLRQIARELRPFGRMRIRINHECTGDWFTHNQRYSYQEIGDFFVKFKDIIKEEAPGITVVFCAGGAKDDETGELEYEKELLGGYKGADVWSMDCYLALHYGWPFDVCEKGGTSFSSYTVDTFYEKLKRSVERLTYVNDGVEKPFVISEFNTDGDVTGPKRQGESVRRFLEKVKKEDDSWFSAVTMYQFRDRGRLGLEIEDPNNSEVGIPQPIMQDYKKFLADPYFNPTITPQGETKLPVKLRWGGAEDAEGLAITLALEKAPEFFEVSFAEELNLMMEINGRWFYKAPETKTIDVMSAFFDEDFTEGREVTLTIFAPPASGENDPSQGEDWDINYYETIHELPQFRIRYESVKDIG